MLGTALSCVSCDRAGMAWCAEKQGLELGGGCV